MTTRVGAWELEGLIEGGGYSSVKGRATHVLYREKKVWVQVGVRKKDK